MMITIKWRNITKGGTGVLAQRKEKFPRVGSITMSILRLVARPSRVLFDTRGRRDP